jgi:hypothetical protein
MGANIGDTVQPVKGLTLNIVYIDKGSQRHEIPAQIFYARFHLSFFIGRTRIAGYRFDGKTA